MNYETEKSRFQAIVGKFFLDPPEGTKLESVLQRMRLVPDPLSETSLILKELGRMKAMVAGGAIASLFTDMHVNDLDFYMEDPKLKDELVAFLSRYFKEPPFISANCVTFKRKSGKSRKVWTVQLITRFDGTPEDIFSNFDFTVTTGAYCFSDEKFYFGDRFFPDIAAKRLTYLGASKYPICALWRTKKYQARGYSCPGSTIMHISLSIVRLNIRTYKELKEQLLGIDTIFLQNLLNKACYDEELPVDYGKFIQEALDYLNVYQPDESDD